MGRGTLDLNSADSRSCHDGVVDSDALFSKLPLGLSTFALLFGLAKAGLGLPFSGFLFFGFPVAKSFLFTMGVRF